MSIEHCWDCSANIDTDFDTDHFPCAERLVPARGGSAVMIPVSVKRERQKKSMPPVAETLPFLTQRYAKQRNNDRKIQ